MEICKFCSREFTKKNKSMYHQNRCNFNPNRLPVMHLSQEHKDKLVKSRSINSTGKASTVEKELERIKKIKETAKLKGTMGGLRKGSGRGKKQWYDSPIAGKVYLRSSLELRYVQYLDKNKINWRQCTESFIYQFENKTRKYYPDFYLIDQDLYIETKGFKTPQDEAKWSQFPKNIKVLYEIDVE
jgi:hypothetical protein